MLNLLPFLMWSKWLSNNDLVICKDSNGYRRDLVDTQEVDKHCCSYMLMIN